MDIAKAIAVLVKNEGKAIDYIGQNKVKKRGIPTIMVPTTAGTGSETTLTAVFTQGIQRKREGLTAPIFTSHLPYLTELTIDFPHGYSI
jgi:alcohol dehydrogenase class IV